MNAALQETIDYIARRVGYAGGAFLSFRDGKTVEKGCYGMANVEKGEPVTEETLFEIASMSKSFCTVLVSMLCDEGLLSWDATVKTYWPEFHLYDPYVTEHATLRDLACHRIGICSHNMQRRRFKDGCLDLEAFSKAVLDLEPCFTFRERFAYQNEFYGVLGYLAERVTGKRYHDLLRERIGKPLGMELFFRNDPDRTETRYAVGYEVHGLELKEINHSQAIGANTPAGGIVTNLNSIEKWIKFLAAGCVTEQGERLLSEAAFKNLIKPNIFWNDVPYPDQCKDYALGLAPSTYRGEKLCYHGGSLYGFRSAQGFFPRLNAGYVILTNSEAQPYSLLKNVLCDIALSKVETDYHAMADRRIDLFLNKPDPETKRVPKAEFTDGDAKTYAIGGVYSNKAYGDITLTYDGENMLRLQYCGLDFHLAYRGNGIFQGGPDTDIRFDEGGDTARISWNEFYTPTLLQRN